MKRMLFVCVALAMLFGVATVNADSIHTTADDGWFVAFLGHQTDKGEDWVPSTGSAFNASEYAEAAKNTYGANIWWWEGELVNEKDSVWISRANGMDENGYYSYMTSVDGSALLGLDSMSLTFTADDRIMAIFVNGKQVEGGVLPQGTNGNTWESLTTFDGVMFSDYFWNENGDNWIEFIVENDNRLDSYDWGTKNWTGLFAEIKFLNSDQSETTPEPATLLILGLGAVGAGLAARRRK